MKGFDAIKAAADGEAFDLVEVVRAIASYLVVPVEINVEAILTDASVPAPVEEAPKVTSKRRKGE